MLRAHDRGEVSVSTTLTDRETAAPRLLRRQEGVDDVWWPFVPGGAAGRHTNKVLATETGGRLFQTIVAYPKGAAPPLHVHHDAVETFFVLSGEVTILVGTERYECAAGDFVLGPRGEPHSFLVRSDGAEILATFSPGGIERFFDEVAPRAITGQAPPKPWPPDPDEFVRLMAKYDCEFVAPPPTLDDWSEENAR
jgi:mannose-6-phosphate isomerase-like protein (cupin superfamily)